jgi:hypothetical protein
MAVFIWEKDAFKKVCEVEAKGHEELRDEYIEQDRNFGPVSFFTFLRAWQEVYVREPELTTHTGFMTINGNGAFYGRLGWNRYCVAYTGEIVLLEQQSTRECIALAKELGFKIIF